MNSKIKETGMLIQGYFWTGPRAPVMEGGGVLYPAERGVVHWKKKCITGISQ